MRKRTKAGNPGVAIAYCRVSTDLARQELGAEAQHDAIRRWAAKEGVTIARWFDEEVSGGAELARRPILLQAMAAVAAEGAGLLVVHRLDRFSRDPLTAALAEAELRRHGASLACADGGGGGTDPTAELIRGVLLAVGRFERAMIRARIRSALAVKRSRGELTGRAPFGFRRGPDGKALEEHPAEQAALTRVRELRAEGRTLEAVIAQAASEGHLSRTGRPFTLAAVHKLVSGIDGVRSSQNLSDSRCADIPPTHSVST